MEKALGYRVPIGRTTREPQSWRVVLEVGVLFWKILALITFSDEISSLSSLLANNIPALVLCKRGIGYPYVGRKYLHGFLSRHIGLPPGLDTEGRGAVLDTGGRGG